MGINAKLDQLIRLRDVPTSTSEPLKVTVTNKNELELLQSIRNQLRNLPPELVAAADWTKLGDTLAGAGLFPEAGEAHEAAAAAARSVADRESEAEAEYKRFRDLCETDDRAAAMTAFHRAVELDPERFTPFDLDRYIPSAVLGIGGFGTVFLADDQYVRVGKDKRPQKVAIKAVHDSGWDAILERDLSETFDEADTLTTLNHPGIIKTLNRGFGDPRRRNRPYLVLEYFPGVTLDACLRTKVAPSVPDVLVIAQQMAEAVHAAHRVGIYHRDIKPANVMVSFDEKTNRWQVKVIDFGLAVKLHAARTSTSVPSGRRTALDRSLVGTMRYTPPEQRNELDADVGPYSDVYAWGKTCLDLLFATTEPKSLHWRRLPDPYRDRVQALLERATLDDIENSNQDHCRFPSFEPVLTRWPTCWGVAFSGAGSWDRAGRDSSDATLARQTEWPVLSGKGVRGREYDDTDRHGSGPRYSLRGGHRGSAAGRASATRRNPCPVSQADQGRSGCQDGTGPYPHGAVRLRRCGPGTLGLHFRSSQAPR